MSKFQLKAGKGVSVVATLSLAQVSVSGESLKVDAKGHLRKKGRRSIFSLSVAAVNKAAN